MRCCQVRVSRAGVVIEVLAGLGMAAADERPVARKATRAREVFILDDGGALKCDGY